MQSSPEKKEKDTDLQTIIADDSRYIEIETPFMPLSMAEG